MPQGRPLGATADVNLSHDIRRDSLHSRRSTYGY